MRETKTSLGISLSYTGLGGGVLQTNQTQGAPHVSFLYLLRLEKKANVGDV